MIFFVYVWNLLLVHAFILSLQKLDQLDIQQPIVQLQCQLQRNLSPFYSKSLMHLQNSVNASVGDLFATGKVDVVQVLAPIGEIFDASVGDFIATSKVNVVQVLEGHF